MRKLLGLMLVTLILSFQSIPVTTHAEMVKVTEEYNAFYLDGYGYKLGNGIKTTTVDYDVTEKILIKHDSIELSPLNYHYIHFWDASGNYLLHYVTTGANECNGHCIGTLTSSVVPIPVGAYTFALERYDVNDSDDVPLLNYSVISDTAWTNQVITSTFNQWDDQVSDSIMNGFLMVVSGLIGFIMMFIGLRQRGLIWNLLSISAFVFFTIQFTAIPMIILGSLLILTNLLLIVKGVSE